MKIYLLSIISLSVLSSCSKDPQVTQQRAGDTEPSIVSVKFSPVSAGGSFSVKFDVNLNIPDTSSIKEVNLYRLPNMKVWYVAAPETKSYIMYDHVIDTYPTYPSNTFYQFEFVMKSGAIILKDKFQVY